MYKIVVKKKVLKFIESLPKQEKARIVAAIERLPNGEDVKRLKGHADLFRLRVGDYRIIYTVDHGVDRLCDTICNLSSDTIRRITGRNWIVGCFS